MSLLTPFIKDLRSNGWSQHPQLIDSSIISEIRSFIKYIHQSSTDPSVQLYREKNRLTSQLVLARVEGFLETRPVFKALVHSSFVDEILIHFFGEPGILFKEKINFRQSGSNGYGPHQDHPAYAMFPVSRYLTLGIFLEDMNDSHGILSFASGQHLQGIFPFDQSGQVEPEIQLNWNWSKAQGPAGTLFVFDSFTPHFSVPNDSNKEKPILYLTFNKKSEGDHRKTYYERKAISLKEQSEDFIFYNFANPFAWENKE